MVLCPTRELAHQVVDEFYRLSEGIKVRVVAVVGGDSSYRQIELINQGAQIVVATPGRLLDHLSSKKLKHFIPKTVVLDEADEMLDMGFIVDIKKIFKFLPEERRTMLFSATMPRAVLKLAGEVMKSPEHVVVGSPETQKQSIEEQLYVINEADKVDALVRLMSTENIDKGIVFCRTRMNRRASVKNSTKVVSKRLPYMAI